MNTVAWVDRRGAPAEATRDLYEQYGAQIFVFCLRRLRSREEAEDAVQHTFLNAFRGLKRGVAPDSESAWLFTIAHNVCLTRRRSIWRRRRVEMSDDLSSLQEFVPAPEAIDPHDLITLGDALGEMPESQRRAILLREWQGLSYREIGEELGLSQSAVEALIFRARRSLASRLDEESSRPARLGRLRHALDAGWLAAALKALLGGGTAAKAVATAAVATTAVVVASGPLTSSVPERKPPEEVEAPKQVAPPAVSTPRASVRRAVAAPVVAQRPVKRREVRRAAASKPVARKTRPPVSKRASTPVAVPQPSPESALPPAPAPVTPVPEGPPPRVDTPRPHPAPPTHAAPQALGQAAPVHPATSPNGNANGHAKPEREPRQPRPEKPAPPGRGPAAAEPEPAVAEPPAAEPEPQTEHPSPPPAAAPPAQASDERASAEHGNPQEDTEKKETKDKEDGPPAPA